MRSTLAISPNWQGAGGGRMAAAGQASAGWLAEPGLGDNRLKMSGLFPRWPQPGR